MAKDGTMRGGSRPRSGPKPKTTKAKILDGDEIKKPKPAKLKGVSLKGVDMPDVDEWLSEKQEDNSGWDAKDLTVKTFLWLKEHGCEKKVTIQQIYAYSVPQARWIQCQRAISKYGLLGENVNTKVADVSPFVKMSDIFYKQAASAWFTIAQIVKENGSDEVGSPEEELMASLIAD